MVPFRAGLLLSSLARHAVTELPTANGPADYALFGWAHGRHRRGQEAHARAAERADPGRTLLAGLPTSQFNFDGLRVAVPVLDQRRGHLVPRRPQPAQPLAASRGFHTPAALSEMLARDFDAELRPARRRSEQSRLCSGPTSVEANTAVEQAIAERKRKMLVAMATGTGKTLHDGQRGLPADEVRRRPPRAVPGRPPRAGRPGRPGVRLVRAEPGLKFDKIYPVYSPALPAGRPGRGREVRPQRHAERLLTNPKLGDAFVYVCTIQRMAINLFGRRGARNRGDEPVRRRLPSSSTSRSMPST